MLPDERVLVCWAGVPLHVGNIVLIDASDPLRWIRPFVLFVVLVFFQYQLTKCSQSVTANLAAHWFILFSRLAKSFLVLGNVYLLNLSC